MMEGWNVVYNITVIKMGSDNDGRMECGRTMLEGWNVVYNITVIKMGSDNDGRMECGI